MDELNFCVTFFSEYANYNRHTDSSDNRDLWLVMTIFGNKFILRLQDHSLASNVIFLSTVWPCNFDLNPMISKCCH